MSQFLTSMYENIHTLGKIYHECVSMCVRDRKP